MQAREVYEVLMYEELARERAFKIMFERSEGSDYLTYLEGVTYVPLVKEERELLFRAAKAKERYEAGIVYISYGRVVGVFAMRRLLHEWGYIFSRTYIAAVGAPFKAKEVEIIRYMEWEGKAAARAVWKTVRREREVEVPALPPEDASVLLKEMKRAAQARGKRFEWPELPEPSSSEEGKLLERLKEELARDERLAWLVL